MKTLLICHQGADLDQEVLARWLASFSELTGVVALQETKQRMGRRIKREVKRVGWLRFVDVLAFRAYYKALLSEKDQAWERETVAELSRRYSPIDGVPILSTHSPNSAEAEKFIKERRPDIILARCKTLLKEEIFSLASCGTFVMHPGVCPEYRNAHGCFWALANDDRNKVGMTLLRIDKGVDTGPVYGYYTYAYDSVKESHIRIQHRVVLENLDALQKKLLEIYKGDAIPLNTAGRSSATWGQPWLTKHLMWKYKAKRNVS